jgi:glycosyltransferase involved in cell wall biosynthesis
VRVLYLVSAHDWPRRITPYSFLDEEIRALAANGIEPYVLSTELADPDQRDGIHVLPVPRGSWPDRLRTIPFLVASRRNLPAGYACDARLTFHAARLERHAVEAIRRHGIELIHTHFAAYGFAGVLARAATGIPLVATFRGMDLLVDRSINYGARQEPFFDRTVRALLQNADLTTYVSDFMRGVGVDLGAAPEAARTIRKGVDLDRFKVVEDRPALQAALGVTGPMILTVAALIPRKGVDTLIAALARLRSAPTATLVVCGEGYARDSLLAMCRELGVTDRVRFCGWIGRDEIPRYFAACDVFVLASRLEASGNVLLEAMASGRPVITTDSGGPPEYVRAGETGYVVEPGNVSSLAERLDRLLSDAALREGMGKAGRRAAEQAYPYGTMVNEYLKVYRQMVRRGGPGSGVVPRVLDGSSSCTGQDDSEAHSGPSV